MNHVENSGVHHQMVRHRRDKRKVHETISNLSRRCTGINGG